MTEALAFRTQLATDSIEQETSPACRPVEFPLQNPARPAIPTATMERLQLARERLLEAARSGARIRTYEVALDLDMSEFHFARQFRLAFDCSPHVFYDQARAERARALLEQGLSEGVVARKIGLRRPAELRALLAKR